jgi:hypothetical protein
VGYLMPRHFFFECAQQCTPHMTPTVPASDGKDPAGTSKSMRRKNCPVTSSFIQDGQLDAARIQQGDRNSVFRPRRSASIAKT